MSMLGKMENIFLRNVAICVQVQTASKPRRVTSTESLCWLCDIVWAEIVTRTYYSILETNQK
jgi:hypothetical protein